MRAWLVSWILRLLRRLTAWLSRPEEVGRIEPVDSPHPGAPEHWIRRAAPPPPAHWLARVRAAVPLEAVEPASQPPAPAGEVPQTVAPPPQRRRAEPALLAPKRPSSPDAPPAGKGGSSFPRREAAPRVPEEFGTSRPASEWPERPERKVRIVTRIEEDVPFRVRRTSEPASPLADPPRTSPVDVRGPSARRLFDILQDPAPAAPVRRDAPAVLPAPPPERKRPVELSSPRLKTSPAAERPPFVPAPRRSTPSAFEESGMPELDVHLDELQLDRPASRATAAPSHPDAAVAWPELAVRPPEDDEPWRAAALEAERRRRLDLEQRGKPWSE